MNTPTPSDRDRAIHFLAATIPPETLANVRMMMAKLPHATPCQSAPVLVGEDVQSVAG